jgi:hypothetical protein
MRRRKACKGYQLLLLVGMILIGLMVSALAIDYGYYYAAQNRLQTAADSGSLAAVQELYLNSNASVNTKLQSARGQAQSVVSANMTGLNLDTSDVLFGYVNPVTRVYDPNTFRTPSSNSNYTATGGYNAVRVATRRSDSSINGSFNTIMSNLFGVSKFNAQAYSVAMMDQNIGSITNGGLRPIYACQAQFNTTMQDGVPENNTVRIYGDHVEVDGVQNAAGCPAMGSGNWSFADFTDCGPGSVGTSTIKDWFTGGYPGTVDLGKCYSTDPGNFISSISDELNTLISDKTVFPIPLYNSFSGNGSNTQVTISGLAGFQISDYQANGNQADRYIEGHFHRYVCSNGCTSNSSGNTSGPGGSVVKLRLASRS